MIVQKRVYLINLGDSRAIGVNFEGKSIILNEEHTPKRIDEKKRIEDLGGWVIPIKNVLRVQGTLNLSRAFGDKMYKPFISCIPDVIPININNFRYIILATDGLWDVYNFYYINKIA